MSEILDDSTLTLTQKKNRIHNLLDGAVEEAIDFVSRCVFETQGVRITILTRTEADADTIYGAGHWASMNIFENPSLGEFYEANEPRYLKNKYIEGSFSAAICAQFLETMNDPAPWKMCHSPFCDKYFKYKNVDKNKGERKRPGDLYCSSACMKRRNQEVYNTENKAIRNALRHGYSGKKARKYVESKMTVDYKGQKVNLLTKKEVSDAQDRWQEKLEQE